ncbi:FecR family protein [Sphingomonas kyeonggiensis]|uniref:Transmembrane sensor n=1 Tax=Sphingomonas kyeonggiensis TaxID=1268553 RepID=A0A7W6JRP7_9SPHN|nr:FecR domain-containing protein [Sphingomonas kyeonggiensis]MBB4098260.1 transmembrane sensor [Sphingomonas kyeonggiensis]
MVREALTQERLRAMPVDEAAALLAVRRAEGLTASEEGLLADWLAADPAHARAFALAGRGWDAFDAGADDEILAAMRAHALVPRRRDWLGWPQLAGVAAAVLLLVAVGLWWMPSRVPGGPAGPTVQEIAWSRYAAPAERVRDVTLADGSVMTLDAGSVAEVRFAADARAIRLVRGRALFEVAHDPARPFGVMAATRRVVALGTRFVVDLDDDMLKVMLIRGKVAVEPMGEGEAVTLMPGQRFTERGDAVSVAMVPAPVETPAWSQGLVDLNDVPLSQAIAEINRHARIRIVIRDPRIAALRVSGQFRAGEAERFANTVAELHGLRVIRRAKEIELARK